MLSVSDYGVKWMILTWDLIYSEMNVAQAAPSDVLNLLLSAWVAAE